MSLALIHKNHGPDAVVGRWNAIGGKCETGSAGQPESPESAMWREFLEETGVNVAGDGCGWTKFLILSGEGWEVYFFHAFSSKLLSGVKTIEEEEVKTFRLDDNGLAVIDVVPNLRWIIPMAKGHEDDHVWVYAVIERETFQPTKRHVEEAN